MNAKRKIIRGIGLATAVMLAVHGVSQTPRQISQESSLVQGNTAFAADLYGQIKNQPGNLCFSPYGIATAMAMTYAGARGQTEQEMARTLHFTLPQKELHAAFGNMTKSLQGLERSGITLTVANAFWCQNHYPINSNYTRLLQNDYRAGIFSLDFNHPSASAKQINSWFSDRTKGMIQNMITPDQIVPDTRAVIGNAVYFKGQWAEVFEQRNTRDGPFWVGRDASVKVPMMAQESYFKLASFPTFSLLELPYQGDELSMLLLLPKTNDGLAGLEKQFTAANVNLWLKKLGQTNRVNVLVKMPRLKTSSRFALDKTLARMGMPSLFNSNANLTGINGGNELYVSSITHQAVIDINEEGTEAAAGTALVFEKSVEKPPALFIADHPFLYLLVDHRNGNILFCGRIVDPTKTSF